MQIVLASEIAMMRPAAFGFNSQTAGSNSFQQAAPEADVQAQVLAEFDAAVAAIKAAGIQVQVLHDQAEPPKPDAIFLNNWFSTHADGRLLLYPMLAPNRQLEVRTEHIAWLESRPAHRQTIDLRLNAASHPVLEGTGSIVFDHAHQLAVAVKSARTSPELLQEVATMFGYKALLLEAADAQGREIYHTNVVMSISPKLAICCFKALRDPDQAALLAALLQRNGRRVIPVSLAQMASFCCNALVVQTTEGQPRILLSETAWNAFEAHQQLWIAEVAEPLVLPISTIETVGGGSVRCMLAELW
jgi:hypothetical protein